MPGPTPVHLAPRKLTIVHDGEQIIGMMVQMFDDGTRDNTKVIIDIIGIIWNNKDGNDNANDNKEQ